MASAHPPAMFYERASRKRKTGTAPALFAYGYDGFALQHPVDDSCFRRSLSIHVSRNTSCVKDVSGDVHLDSCGSPGTEMLPSAEQALHVVLSFLSFEVGNGARGSDPERPFALAPGRPAFRDLSVQYAVGCQQRQSMVFGGAGGLTRCEHVISSLLPLDSPR